MVSRLLLKNCNILDGTKDMEVKANQDILITDGIIAEIGTDLKVSKAKVIDLKGAYVTPGLINLHVHIPGSGKVGKKKVADLSKLIHLMTTKWLFKKVGLSMCSGYAKTELYSGVTTLRAVGGISDFDTIVRDKINAGKVDGPRILASNLAIGVVGGHMDGTVAKAAKNNEEAVKLVEEANEQGVDLIKLMITGGCLDCKKRGEPGDLKMDASMVKAVCDKAHELGLMVAAHVEGPEGIRVAVENGVDTIEHGSIFDDDLIEPFKARGGALVCTLSPAVALSEIDPEVSGYGELVQYNTKALMTNMIECTKKLRENGILVGLGTDTGCPYVTHYDMYRELVYYKKYIGVSSAEALHTATLVNAKIAGIDSVTGSVSVGKCADLLVVKNNPLDDLRYLGNLEMVLRNGSIYKKKNKKMANVEEQLNKLM